MSSRDNAYASETGRTTIAPAVLLTITRLTVLSVPGVARLAAVPGGVNRLFRRGVNEGIRVEVGEATVALEVHLVLAPESNALEVAHRVQADVARAVEETVGMAVSRVDVHVEDVEFARPAG